MRFDAYSATIRQSEIGYVAQSLASSLGGIVCKGKPMRRYPMTLQIDAGPRMAAWCGTDSQTGDVFVEGKGETAPVLAKSIRTYFPDHSCARADVCEDYDEPGAFGRLLDLVRRTKGQRVKGGYVALPDDEQDGKTWAAGTRGGVGYVRVYEAGKHPDRVHLAKPDWARIEGEFRPHYSRDKIAAAKMQPVDFWGLSAWTHTVGERLTQTQINRFEPEIRKYSHDKTTRYIALTFRRHFQEMLEDGLHLEATIREVWKEEDEARKQGRRR